MSRSARLLDLLQLLRRHRRPVAAAFLGTELGVSTRTVYRDIATLRCGLLEVDTASMDAIATAIGSAGGGVGTP